MRGLVLAVAVLLAACGRGPEAPEAKAPPPVTKIADKVCGVLSREEVEAALGASLAGASEEADKGGAHPGCTWLSAEQPDGERSLVATIYRAEAIAALAPGGDFYADQSAALRGEFPKVGALEGVGEAALMGLAPHEDGTLDGAIIARKGGAVMSLTMKGADPSAFEAAAAKLAAAL